MCNNNGACRSLGSGVMCPSYRVTRDERDVTRGRANTLRLALSGQLGAGAITSDAMHETLKLCVSCKACRRECPTGVDMARMKIEVMAARADEGQLTFRDRLIAYLPRYARAASRIAGLMNLRDRLPMLARLSEKAFGLTARRPLPRWRRDTFQPERSPAGGGKEVALLADTFNTYFEPENLSAATSVLSAAGYAVHHVRPADGKTRPLCCGRTFLSAGLVSEARREMQRLVAAVLPFVERGVAIVGIEPSCLLTLRDELGALLPGVEADRIAASALLFEEFIVRESEAGHLKLAFRPVSQPVHIHGHCHQKSFGALSAVEKALRLIPDVKISHIASSCCGMAGAFGYQSETYETSMKMAELSLLPAVRKLPQDAIVVADGTSCRDQIEHGSGRTPVHAARVLQGALARD
jgi:Fe-S oxidoreductase